MDLFYIILILLVVGGVVLLFAPLFSGKKAKNEAAERAEEQAALMNYMNLNAKKSEVETSIEEADSVITEIHDMSQSVLKEIDDKYQELLFLYNLIEDKRSDRDKRSAEPVRDEEAKPVKSRLAAPVKSKIDYVIDDAPKIDLTIGEMTTRLFKHPKLAEIRKLKQSGASISDIARKLGVGQGEVTLILELAEKGGFA